MEMTRAELYIVFALLVISVPAITSESPELKIDPEVRTLFLTEGSRQVLDCYVKLEHEDSPNGIQWRLPRSGLQVSDRTMTDTPYTYHRMLVIDSFSPSYAGRYICSYQSIESTIELVTVTENKIEGEYYYPNKSVTLQCTLEFGDRKVDSSFREWRKDDVLLSDLKEPQRFTDSKNGTLFIDKPTRNDSGLYTAIYDLDRETYSCEVKYFASPLVLDLAKSKNVIEGDTLHLECTVIGYPIANVTWLKNGEPLVEDGERVLFQEFNGLPNARLEVKSAAEVDEGNYTCAATDSFNRTNGKSITVRVKDRLDWLYPVIGIVCELIVLTIIIFICSKVKKDDAVDKPADEREGLLRQGARTNREHDKEN